MRRSRGSALWRASTWRGRLGRRGSAAAASLPGLPASPRPRLVDLSHTIEHGMTTYPGLPGPLICDYLSREASRAHYAPGVEFQIGKIEMVANTGTYLDSPFHRYAEGKDLAQLALESLADLDAVVVRVLHADGRAIAQSAFQDLDLEGKAVLVQTGWDVHWRTERYLSGHPFLTGDAAEYLVNKGVALVGIDSLNIDDTLNPARPVHSILLGAEVPIVEHLCNLSRLPEQDFRFFAVPPRVNGVGTWPVRAFGHVLPPNHSLGLSRRSPSLG
ncbi:MAG TPA: cyclase family protein [Gemmatimonadales bacterium]|nr:cyclase family protein [Gemmatimonadales bacterium]